MKNKYGCNKKNRIFVNREKRGILKDSDGEFRKFLEVIWILYRKQFVSFNMYISKYGFDCQIGLK